VDIIREIVKVDILLKNMPKVPTFAHISYKTLAYRFVQLTLRSESRNCKNPL